MNKLHAEKKEWIKKRFGNIDNNILGEAKNCPEIIIDQDYREYHKSKNGDILEYCIITDINKHASRIAEIYQNAVDEMVGNSSYEWHHDPKQIIDKVSGGDYFFVGCFMNEELIAVLSNYIVRGQRSIQIIWGAVDPVFRGNHVWGNFGPYTDKVCEKSKAERVFVWAASTHPWTQMTCEKAGFKPMGIFPGGEWLGGTDGKYYRQNVIYYGKLYNEGLKHMQSWDSMMLTDDCKKIANAVKEVWNL